MRLCPLLNNNIQDDQLLSWKNTSLPLKAQKIIAISNMNYVGCEILLDNRHVHSVPQGSLSKHILNGCALEHILNFLYKNQKNVYSWRKVFINVERVNLCNKILLRKIVATSNFLHIEHDVELVVEITERNICGYCSSISEGLLYLTKNRVSLAVDDYNIYGGDFRKNEVNLGIYNYIKIEMPSDINDISKMSKFILNNKKKRIIIERIENQEQLNLIESMQVYGAQGFLFDKGSLIT